MRSVVALSHFDLSFLSSRALCPATPLGLPGFICIYFAFESVSHDNPTAGSPNLVLSWALWNLLSDHYQPPNLLKHFIINLEASRVVSNPVITMAGTSLSCFRSKLLSKDWLIDTAGSYSLIDSCRIEWQKVYECCFETYVDERVRTYIYALRQVPLPWCNRVRVLREGPIPKIDSGWLVVYFHPVSVIRENSQFVMRFLLFDEIKKAQNLGLL